MPEQKYYPAYGVLNKLEKAQVTSKVNLENFDAAITNRKIVKEFYTYDVVTSTGPYKGVVLRIEDKDNPPTGGWLDKWFNGKGKTPSIVRIKVRIPEIHAMLPIPNSLGWGDEKNPNPDTAIIDMYPTFVGQNDGPECVQPVEGTLVWVDYGNKVNFTDPIYLRPVSVSMPGPGGKGNISPADKHNNRCAGSLQADPPKGDELSGRNKALSHSGLPLIPRKLSNVNIGEGVVKGPVYNALTVSTWTKEMKASGVPGLTWVGNIKFNGIDDKTHSLGKRETIIFSPNATDYSAPVELIYFFHGVKEFNDGKDFQKRYPSALKKMAEDNRNFIFVLPELSWSKASISAQSNVVNKNVWKGNDNFSNFHSDVLATIKESFSDKVQIGYISVISGNNGSVSILSALKNGMDNVKPNRLVLTEVTNNFSELISIAKDSVIQVVVKKGSDDEKRFNQVQGKEKVDFKAFDKSKENIWNDIIQYVGQVTNNLKQEGSKLPAPKNADVSPGTKEKTTIDGNGVVIEPARQFVENRVYVAQYGALQGTEEILVDVPSTTIPPQKLHILAAKRLALMNSAWKEDNPGQPEIKIASGWRKKGFSTEADYEAFLIQKYGSIKEGRKWLAYDSAHQTGLVMDIGNNGLLPIGETSEQQKQTRLYKWLVKNAYLYGFTPYSPEPWQIECALPKESWATGQEFTNDLAVRVINPGKGTKFPMASNENNKECVQTVADLQGSNPQNPNGSLGRPAGSGDKLNLIYSDFARKGTGKPAPSVSMLVAKARQVDLQWGNLIRKFQGNVPYGLICVRIAHESGGRAKSPPSKCCGETSLLQIWCGKSFYEDYVTYGADKAVEKGNFQPGRLGAVCKKVKPDFNPFNPEDNLWGGLSDWNRRGYRLIQREKKYFTQADQDFWGCVNIGMNAGDGSLSFLLKLANPSPGNVLNDLSNYVDKHGEDLVQYEKIKFGGQTAASIVRRVQVTNFWVEAAKQLNGESLLTADFGMKGFLNFA